MSNYITVITCTDVYQVRDEGQHFVEMPPSPSVQKVEWSPHIPIPNTRSFISAKIKTFYIFKEGQEEPEFFKMAWHPDFEDTLGIAMSVFEQQTRNVAEYYDRIGNLQHIKINLELKLVDFDKLSFWGRLKFLFRGSIDHE